MPDFPDQGNIHPFANTNKDVFGKVVMLLNYYNEAMKFFPEFEINGYKTGENAFQLDFNNDGKPDKEYVEVEQKEIGRYPVAAEVGAAWKEFKGSTERYGDWHRQGFDGGVFGYKLFGQSGIASAADNISFDADASSFWNFKDTDKLKLKDYMPNDPNNPIDMVEYLKVVYKGYSGANNSLSSIYSGELSNAKNLLASYFPGENYYEIAMKGAKTLNLVPNGKDVDMNASGGGIFGYDGLSSEGAYSLMLMMLESRRRLDYASAYTIGSSYMIHDNKAMIEYQNNRVKELSPANTHNLRPFKFYFALQHSLRSAMVGLAGGVNGYNGYIYSAKDKVGMNRFRNWLSLKVTEFASGKDDSEKARISNLLNEYQFKIDQPYGGQDYGTAIDENHVGWDQFSPYKIDPNDPSTFPSGFVKDDGDSHPNYVAYQLPGGPDKWKTMAPNWVRNLMLNYNGFDKTDEMGVVTVFAIRSLERMRYSREMRIFREKLTEAKNEEFEKNRDNAKAAAKSEAKHNEINKQPKAKQSHSTNKQQSQSASSNSANEAKTYQAAMKGLKMAMLQKALNRRKSDKAEKSE